MKSLEQTDASESQATHNTIGGLPFLSTITNADVTGAKRHKNDKSLIS
jgi:hypothetical protein